jgi:HptB-dependent secretion and biofilm anti anti-sigma factor
MSITATASANGAEVRVRLPQRFDFSTHKDFRKAYEAGTQGQARYVVDMRETSYMDSAALGMLLQMWEHCGRRTDAIRIVNATPTVKDILAIANFQKLMHIE